MITLISLIKNSKKYFIAFLPAFFLLLLAGFWLFRSEKKVLYYQPQIEYLRNKVKAKLKDDVKVLNPEQFSQEAISQLGEKILAVVDQSQSQFNQQIKATKNKITIKTSIKGEAVVPLTAGRWQLKTQPIDKVNIYLPKEKLVINKDDKGIVIYIPFQEGKAKVVFSEKVLAYPLNQTAVLKSKSSQTKLTLSRFLADEVSQEKIALIFIFNDKNNNLIFDSWEKLVPWAGVTFILKK